MPNKIRLLLAFAVAPIVGVLARSLCMLVVASANGIGFDRSFQAVIPVTIVSLLVGYVVTVGILAPVYFLLMRKRSPLGLMSVMAAAFILTFFFIFIYAWGIFDPYAYTLDSGGKTVHVVASISKILAGLRAGLDAAIWSAVGGFAFWFIINMKASMGSDSAA